MLSIDLAPIYLPFMANASHEHIYGRIVKQIDAASDREWMNVAQQYGATNCRPPSWS
ncbi:hypothetical protein [Xanthobacter autotrophicus]|uniref:hypothetical protein n=1 Tax=Xanthobacter autotrophicus TaxID=280 RepID=UPI0024A62B29|nr:hypothetical protein [Xanthobacter autotrophicus]MDI4659037.1 hypothetical protein [Xanthobacter autotrophicus]